jgi:hypothetical protein
MPPRHCISQLAVGPRGHVEGGGTRAGWWHAFTWVDGPMSCVRAVQDGALWLEPFGWGVQWTRTRRDAAASAAHRGPMGAGPVGPVDVRAE